MDGRSRSSSFVHTRIIKCLDLWILSCFLLLKGLSIILLVFFFRQKRIHYADTIEWVSCAPFIRVLSSRISAMMSAMKAPITGIATRSTFCVHPTHIHLRQCTNALPHWQAPCDEPKQMSAHFKGLTVGSPSGVNSDASSISPQARVKFLWGCMVRMHSTFSPLKRLSAVGRSACPRQGVLGVARSEIDLCPWLWARVLLCLFFRGHACQAHASAELGDSSPTLSLLPRLHCFLLHFGHAYSLQKRG